MIVLDCSMNLDLTHQLLFGSALCQTRFLDDLGCMDELRLSVDELVTLGKTSLAKILTLYISLDTYLATGLFEFFLNNLLLLDCIGPLI